MYSAFLTLSFAGLDAEYGCVDLDDPECSGTTQVKFLQYVDSGTGAVVEHRYASGDPTVPSSTLSPSYQLISGFITNLDNCNTGVRIESNDDCDPTAGTLPSLTP